MKSGAQRPGTECRAGPVRGREVLGPRSGSKGGRKQIAQTGSLGWGPEGWWAEWQTRGHGPGQN